MAELREKDSMVCRSCMNEERASEGYPCVTCGTFICVICTFRGVLRCKRCHDENPNADPAPRTNLDHTTIDWPEH